MVYYEYLWVRSAKEAAKPTKIHWKVQKFMFSFTLSKVIQWARLEFLPGKFWPPGLMFDTPALKHIAHHAVLVKNLLRA